MTVPSAVFLVIATVRLVIGGTVSRSACGSTTEVSVARKLRPVERAASHWPFGTDRMPAQKISSAKAASTSASTSQSTANDGRLIPTLGRPKYTSSTRTSGGSARNTSANTTISALTGSTRNARASASTSARPVTTTAAATSTVTTTPLMMAGK